MINEGVIHASDVKNEIHVKNNDVNSSLTKLYETVVASTEILEQQRSQDMSAELV